MSSEVTTNGDYEVTFHLKRPQPSLLSMLATGWTPIYPCHVSPAQMRQHPIGTGPFKFVEFKPNQSIKVMRNPDYWKPGRPYLDGIEYRSSRTSRRGCCPSWPASEDVYFGVTMPQLKDVKNQVPQAICDMFVAQCRPQPARQPRRAAVRQSGSAAGDVADDRPPGLYRHHRRRAGRHRRRSCSRRPRGSGACRPMRCADLPGYDPDVASSRAEGPQDHGEARLRPGQPAAGQGVDAQSRALSRSGGDPDRPVEADLYRRRSRIRSTPRNGIRR